MSFLHLKCIQYAPDNLRNLEITQALVCGKNLTSPETTQLFIASGLIHLFVVSGSHLIILNKMAHKIFNLAPATKNRTRSILTQNNLILALLFFYCGICNFNPPVVRSFIALYLVVLFKKTSLKITLQNITLISGLLCLMLSPSWANSLSLQMSWLAALGLLIINEFYKNASPLIKNSVFYTQYLATFQVLGIAPLNSIIIAITLTSFLEYILFPLALLTYLTRGVITSSVFDLTIDIIIFILSHLELETTSKVFKHQSIIFYNWFIIFLLHYFIYIFRKKPSSNPPPLHSSSC
ncbi:MAG: ComEC/Rec2 family competence protein [Pseudobdellovibrio sp.]